MTLLFLSFSFNHNSYIGCYWGGPLIFGIITLPLYLGVFTCFIIAYHIEFGLAGRLLYFTCRTPFSAVFAGTLVVVGLSFYTSSTKTQDDLAPVLCFFSNYLLGRVFGSISGILQELSVWLLQILWKRDKVWGIDRNGGRNWYFDLGVWAMVDAERNEQLKDFLNRHETTALAALGEVGEQLVVVRDALEQFDEVYEGVEWDSDFCNGAMFACAETRGRLEVLKGFVERLIVQVS